MRESFNPDVPEWLEHHHENQYSQALSEELERVIESPDAYLADQRWNVSGEELPLSWDEYKERVGLNDAALRKLAEQARDTLVSDFEFESLGSKATDLLHALPEQPPTVQDDFSEIVQAIGSRIHRTVLKRLVREHLPRRKAILHRGSFRHINPSLPLPEEGTVGVLNKLGPVGTLLKFAVKDQTYRVEEMRENLERGIGGFEFDIRMNENGEPVVTHASSKEALAEAPSLKAFLDLVRELLPEDPHAPRQARRGLKMFLHLKTAGDEAHPDFPNKILELLDAAGLAGQTYFQTGRPEFLEQFDKAEQQRSQADPKRSSAHYVFQSLPLGELGPGAKGLAKGMAAVGLADRYSDDELRSLTGLVDEQPILSEFPPHGKTLEILQRHGGFLGVPAFAYKKEFLAKAREAGLGIHIGTFDKGEDVEELLGPDVSGNRPATVMSTSADVIFPDRHPRTPED